MSFEALADTAQEVSDPSDLEEKYSIRLRQTPVQGKAIGFKQYFGNFL